MSENPCWYKDAIIYELHVRCFYDSDGDGIGDFAGLTQKLDYLQDLGVTAIWLLPFYPSPLKDDGYDIADYTDIHSTYGCLHDFKIFMREAHRRGLKVITELVVNHTSDQHPWFQRARRAKPGSRYRDYYVWSDKPEKYKEARIIFQDFESSNWSWDSQSKSYYWHRFYSHQPDLNFDNPDVHQAIFRILSFWMKMGVDGIRLDAVPYLYEREGTTCENLPETHGFLKKLRKYVDDHFEDRMLLAEANQWPEDAAKYFGVGDECHMAFHFPIMPRLFMAIHLEDSLPIIEITGQTPKIPENCQWALFLRNHDELTLEMVTDEERDYMFRVYAHDPQARINLGIRRRLSPLLKNDRRKIELMNSLLFSLTGTPVIYYGDEIGMGDNIYLGDRNGVRTPMQWSNDRNAGFSKTNPQRLYLPPIIDPEYHYETVNVEAQQNNPYSILWWTKQLIAQRKRFKAFGHGTTHFLVPPNRKMLVFLRKYQDERILIIANLSRFPQYVELDLSKYNGYYLVELFSGERFPRIGELPYFLTVGPYGYYWFALEKEKELSLATEMLLEKEKKCASVAVSRGGERIFHLATRRSLGTLLRTYLLKRIWFPYKSQNIDKTKTRIIDHFILLSEEYGKIHLVIFQVSHSAGMNVKYPLYLTQLKGEKARRILEKQPENVVVKFKSPKGRKVEGVLLDVSDSETVIHILLNFISKNRRLKGDTGHIRGHTFTPHRKEDMGKMTPSVLRLVEEGMDVDVEMRLFLSKKTTFKHFLPLLGYVEFKDTKGYCAALAKTVIRYPREFDAKEQAIKHAEHFLERIKADVSLFSEEVLTPSCSILELSKGRLPEELHKALETYLEVARQLGETTADFHQALLSREEVEEFASIPFTLFYQRSIYQNIRRKILEAFGHLRLIQKTTSHHMRKEIGKILQMQDDLLEWIHTLPQQKIATLRTRFHGNYTLEHLLYTGKEFLIADFKGNPNVSYYERKYKRSPLIDIVWMLFSFAQTAHTALVRQQSRGVMTEVTQDVLYKWASGWATWMGSSFVRAYLRDLDGLAAVPANSEKLDFLLGLFLIERCAEDIIESGKEKKGEVHVPVMMLKQWLPIYVKP